MRCAIISIVLTPVLTITLASVSHADDRSKLKKIWDSLTPEERALALQQPASTSGSAPAGGRAADTCAEAQPISLNPFDPYGDQWSSYIDTNTTSGATDDYAWGASCGCSPLAPPLGLPGLPGEHCGGFNYLSGMGPDVVYHFRFGTTRRVAARVTPERDHDIALYVTTDCGTVSACIGADDYGDPGEVEFVPFRAEAGTSYYVVLDGFNGSMGEYDLTICSFEDECVPVELQSFSVD